MKLNWKKAAALICLIAVLIPALALAEGENLVKNPGFIIEDGNMTDWYFDMWERSEEAYRYNIGTDVDGTPVLCIENLLPNDSRLEQEISAKGNAIYRVSAKVKAEGFDASSIGANISAMDCFATSTDLLDTHGQWVELEFYGKTGFFQSSFTIALRAGSYGQLNQGTAWFKDVRVERVSAVPQGQSWQSLKKVEASSSSEQSDGANWIPLFTFVCLLAAFLIYVYLPRSHGLFDGDKAGNKKKLRNILIIGLAAAFVLRLVLAVKHPGYDVDINCFKGWSTHMAAVGPMNFYDGIFCDYPPGYLYVLWLIGGIVNLFQISPDSAVFLVLVKLPAILCDLAAAYLIYKMAKEWVGESMGLFAGLVYAFLPAVWLNSAMWGQMDSVLVLLLLLTIKLMGDRKLLQGSLIYAVAVLVKPQALMFGTILLCVFVTEILKDWRKGFKALGICVVSALALVMLLITPFSIGRGYFWIVEKYLSVLTSYPFATVNAMNFFGVIGGNWVEQETVVLGMSYANWGTLGMLVSLGYGLFIYFKRRDNKALLLMSICVLLGVFVLGVRMHERYMFPILVLTLLAALAYDDKRLFLIFLGLSITNGINIFVVLQNMHVTGDDRAIQVLVGALNLFLLIELWFTAFQLAVKGKNVSLTESAKQIQLKPQVLGAKLPSLSSGGEKIKWTRWDLILICVLTLVYSCFAFYKLGNTYAPQSMWQGREGTEVVLDLGEQKDVGRFYYYGEINEGMIEVSVSQDGVNYVSHQTLEVGVHSMFKWHVLRFYDQARYVKMSLTSGDMNIFEVAVSDAEGHAYAAGISPNYAELIDEQWMVPERPGYMDSMYFDEVYHGRTAYEQNNNMEWYENTHPPLGKVFISWSILLFGMTPFGWRFAGTLAGVLMVPAMYYLAKLLFRKTPFAFLATFLMTFDFMHLAQTRLGTIDSYPVLFIILGFAFMVKYAYMSFYHDKLWKTLVPLFFSGLFMGLGIASKWIGAYAAVGLAILFFAILFARFREYRQAQKLVRSGNADANARRVVEVFPKYALITVLCCVVFFVAIPVAIYIASYYQFLRIDAPRHGLTEVWNYQLHMFNYHKGVFESHPYESPWWQWPLMIKPIWYFLGEFAEPGTISSIASFGNPAVWWPGLLAMLWLIYRAAKGYGKRDARIYIILLGFCANYLPWVMVPRITFIYHYFASVPFIILAITLFAEDVYARLNHARTYYVLYLIVVLGLFLLFYPVLTGIPMLDIQGVFLKWLPSWTLF